MPILDEVFYSLRFHEKQWGVWIVLVHLSWYRRMLQDLCMVVINKNPIKMLCHNITLITWVLVPILKTHKHTSKLKIKITTTIKEMESIKTHVKYVRNKVIALWDTIFTLVALLITLMSIMIIKDLHKCIYPICKIRIKTNLVISTLNKICPLILTLKFNLAL